MTTKAITVNVAKRGLVELGQMPPGDPADIVTIDARENRLTEIPPEATFLPNLKTLILDRNAITSLPANTLMKMRSLTALSLQVCKGYISCRLTVIIRGMAGIKPGHRKIPYG